MSPPRASRDGLVLTCEHGGNRVPAPYAHLFRGAEAILQSHRGWDPGALALARFFARKLDRPLFAVTWSRLFVEANRTPTNPRIWSQFTKSLPKEEREQILARWWWPHRQAVTDAVQKGLKKFKRVIHVAVHSFTPVLDGVERNADVGLLYDSRCKHEAAFCRRWSERLHTFDPALRVRFNYPYAGAADGLTTWFRKQYPESRYLGIELEINQALFAAPRWSKLQVALAASLGASLSDN